MAKALEAEWERKLVDVVENWGWKAIKFTPKGDKGWPDRIIVTNRGVNIWFECKRLGERPTPLQYYRHSQLRRLNAAVHWADNLDEAIAILSNYTRA